MQDNNSPFDLSALLRATFEEYEREGYTTDAEGFYICPKCGTRASKRGEYGHIPEACECKKAAEKARQEAQRLEALEARRVRSFAAEKLCGHTFEADNGTNPKITAAMKNYVENFGQYKENGRGLLLYGSTGSGKTFFACCIANALIDKGYHVKQTDFARLGSAMSQTYDKHSVIDDYVRFNSLLILDDLGVERSTPYMKELVYNVINTLYNANVPFIITTNLTASELKKPADPDNVRIYQRILERCHPIEVENPTGSQRIKKFAENYEKDKEILGI